MKNFDPVMEYFEKILGPLDGIPPDPITPFKLVELLWFLNDIFRPHIHQIRTVRYRSKFEKRADIAIEAFSQNPVPGTWNDLHPGVWRVLLERHQQLIVSAMANDASGNMGITSLPAGLTDDQKRVGLMLFWLHEMKLPFAVEDRSRLELPEQGPEISLRRH